jgi:hypothetical protein
MRSVRPIRLIFAMAVLALLVVAVLAAVRKRAPDGSPDVLTAEQRTARPDAEPEARRVPDAPPPEARTSDPQARTLLEAVSSDPHLREWLAAGDLLRRWAVALDNLAEDELPRRDLSFLAPTEQFAATRAGGKLVIDPRSSARWDLVADAVASVDAPAFARAVRALHPLLEASWRALGYPGRSLDARAAQALDRLVEAPLPRDPPELEQAGRLYIYADPALEALGPVEKFLLRMGPRNARRIQLKAQEVADALGYRKAVAAKPL